MDLREQMLAARRPPNVVATDGAVTDNAFSLELSVELSTAETNESMDA